jgi:HEAT repeat protein
LITDLAQSQPNTDDSIDHIKQEAVSHLLQALDSRQGIVQSQMALKALETVNLESARPQVATFLKHSSREIRESAIRALSIGLADSFFVQAVLDKLKNDTSEDVRAEAALAFARWNAKQVVPHLIESLQKDRSIFVRANSALALGALGDTSALPALRSTLDEVLPKYQKAPRREALELSVFLATLTSALVAFKDKSAIPAIRELIAPSSSDPAALGGLVLVIVLAFANDPDFNITLRDAIRQLLTHKHSTVRLHAAIAIRFRGDKSVLPQIAEVLAPPKAGDFEGQVNLYSNILEIFFFSLFGFIEDDELVPPIATLMDALKQPNEGGHSNPLSLNALLLVPLGAIGSAGAINKLISTLNEPIPAGHEPDLINAFKIFGIIGLGLATIPHSKIPQLELIMPALHAYLSDPEPDIRSGAASMLGVSGNLGALTPLIRLLTDKSLINESNATSVRDTAISALGDLGLIGAIPALATLFADPNPSIRIKTAAAILQILDGKKTAPLPFNAVTQVKAFISLTDLPWMSNTILSMRRALPK